MVSSEAVVPPGLERVMRRCLEKDPEERFQSARDVAFALEALSGPSGSETTAARKPERRSLRWAALLAGIAAAILVALWLKGPWGPPPVGAFIPVTSDSAEKAKVALSRGRPWGGVADPPHAGAPRRRDLRPTTGRQDPRCGETNGRYLRPSATTKDASERLAV